MLLTELPCNFSISYQQAQACHVSSACFRVPLPKYLRVRCHSHRWKDFPTDHPVCLVGIEARPLSRVIVSTSHLVPRPLNSNGQSILDRDCALEKHFKIKEYGRLLNIQTDIYEHEIEMIKLIITDKNPDCIAAKHVFYSAG